MIRSNSLSFTGGTTPQRQDFFSHSNTVHTIKFKSSDFHLRKSPCDRDRFFSAERKATRPRLSSAPSGKENVISKEINSVSPYLEKTLRPSIPIAPKKRNAPIAIDNVLDAPDVIDNPPAKLIDFNSKNILAVALGQAVYIWNNGDVSLLMEADSPITSVCWTDDGIVLSARGEVELWDPNKGTIVSSLSSHSGRCTSASFIGHRIATGGADGIISITDIRAASAIPYNAHYGSVSALAWSSDGIHLLSGGTDSKVHVWGDQKKRSYEMKSPVSAVSWISKSIFAVGESSSSGTLSINHLKKSCDNFEVITGSPISGMHYSEKWGLAISHRDVISNWELWSPLDQKKICEYFGHSGDIINLTGNHDGSCFATIGSDESLRIWELREQHHITPRFCRQSAHLIGPTLR